MSTAKSGTRTVGLLPELGDEQRMLLESSVRFVEDRFPLARVRSCVDRGEPVDGDYGRTAAELGWFGLLAEEGHGGGTASGNGVVDAALIAAERGARLQPGPYTGHSVVVHALSRAASASHVDVLAELIKGRSWATWAFSEEPVVGVREIGGDARLDGAIDAVADAGNCGWILVTADAADGLTQILLATDAPGVTCRRVEGIDVTRTWYRVELDGVRITDDDLVGTPGAATESLVRRQEQIAAVLIAADAVGAMDTDFAMALQYAKDRIAFGRPIGSFQAIKHLLADTSLWLEMAKGLVAAAAAAVGSAAGDRALAHAAKSFVGEKSIELAHNCFQVFGGLGYTWEHDQHLFLRRLVANSVSFGSPTWHRTRLLDAKGVPA